MVETFPQEPVSSLSRIVIGGTPSRRVAGYWDGGVKWASAKDVGEAQRFIRKTDETISVEGLKNSSAKVLPRGTVVIVARGATTGNLAQLGEEMAFNQTCYGLVANDMADQDYLYYALKGSMSKIQSLTYGTIFNTITTASFDQLRIPCPRVSEQRAIAEVLSSLDDKIELNRRMNQTLEEIARGLFKLWFLNYGPTRAKAEGRWKKGQTMPGVPADMWDLWSDQLEDSELGEIPKGWGVANLGEVVAEIETGRRPTGGVSGISSGVPSIGAESIVGLGAFDYSKTKFVPREYFSDMKRGKLRDRDILLYKDGGRPGEFEPHLTLVGDGFPFAEACINEHVYRIQSKRPMTQLFLYHWLSSPNCMEEMRVRGTGVAIPGLNSKEARSLTVLVPTEPLLRGFTDIVEPLIARLLSNCTESHKLEQIRDSLLPRLLSGEVRVIGSN